MRRAEPAVVVKDDDVTGNPLKPPRMRTMSTIVGKRTTIATDMNILIEEGRVARLSQGLLLLGAIPLSFFAFVTM